MNNQEVWSKHYKEKKSKQFYPDENVVRFVNKLSQKENLQNQTALDLGSGSGRNLVFLQTFFHRVIGLDFAKNTLDNHHDVVRASALQLPFAENSFHFILCWGLLHYLETDTIESAICEIHRVLELGGTLLLTIRSDEDTHLAKQLTTGDLMSGRAALFSLERALDLFKNFSQVESGYICRRPIGEKELIAHHILAVTR